MNEANAENFLETIYHQENSEELLEMLHYIIEKIFWNVIIIIILTKNIVIILVFYNFVLAYILKILSI